MIRKIDSWIEAQELDYQNNKIKYRSIHCKHSAINGSSVYFYNQSDCENFINWVKDNKYSKVQLHAPKRLEYVELMKEVDRLEIRRQPYNRIGQFKIESNFISNRNGDLVRVITEVLELIGYTKSKAKILIEENRVPYREGSVLSQLHLQGEINEEKFLITSRWMNDFRLVCNKDIALKVKLTMNQYIKKFYMCLMENEADDRISSRQKETV